MRHIDYIIEKIVCKDNFTILRALYETTTLDYIYDISDVERNYINLKVNANVIEKYNIKRDEYDKSNFKGASAEYFSINNTTNYFHEDKVSYNREENFSTAEYYDSAIGRVTLVNSLYINNNDNTCISKDSVKDIFNKLRTCEFELFLSSLTDEYKKEIFK